MGLLRLTRGSRFSRLVFAVPDEEQIDFSSAGILAAMRRLVLVVVPVATPRLDTGPNLDDVVLAPHRVGGLGR